MALAIVPFEAIMLLKTIAIKASQFAQEGTVRAIMLLRKHLVVEILEGLSVIKVRVFLQIQ